MTHSKSKIQNPNFSVSSAFLSDLCALAVQNSSLSSNRRIPNSSWCLFREVSDGSRNGKVVIVQSRDIQDPDTGGQYTVKIYRSEKTVAENSLSHQCIRLEPDALDFNFEPLILVPDTVNQLRVIGDLLGLSFRKKKTMSIHHPDHQPYRLFAHQREPHSFHLTKFIYV